MITPHRAACLRELLDDADDCHRLSDWEEQFLAGIRLQFAREGQEITLSDKQEAVLKKIEARVYAT